LSRRAGIISALPAEAGCYSGSPLSPGLHTGRAWLIHVCGMGAARAARAARETLQHGAQCLISWGVAGALAPQLKSGDVIVPRAILMDGKTLPADTALSAALQRHWQGAPLHDGPLWHSPAVLARAGEKLALHARTGAIAVDMESGAIAVVAAESGAPFLAVRVIVDTQAMTLPTPAVEGVDEYGRVRIGKFLQALCRNPGGTGSLIALGGAFRRARGRLRALAPALQAALAENAQAGACGGGGHGL